MISVTAIQEAQQSAVAAFEDFMDACMDSEWQQVGGQVGGAGFGVAGQLLLLLLLWWAKHAGAAAEKGRVGGSLCACRRTVRRLPANCIAPPPPLPVSQQERRALFDSVAPYTASTALTPGPSPGGALSPYAARPLGGGAAPSPAYHGTPLGGAGLSPLAPGNLALRGRAAKYAEVVRKMSASGGAAGGINVVAEFAAACADEAAGERRTTMARVWQVLAALLGGLGGLPAAARAQRTEALLGGARRYLEANYVAYLQKVVAAHRTQVRGVWVGLCGFV